MTGAGGIRKTFRILFTKYLRTTNTVSYAVLMGMGDVTVQSLERVYVRMTEDDKGIKTPKPLDWKRTGRIAFIGLFIGIQNHYWYFFLDRFAPGQAPRTIAKKILLDQLIAAPWFAFNFLVGAGMLEGQKFKVSLREFRQKFWTVYKADWTVWPAAQAINFYYLPPHLRVLYVSCVTLCWNTFLSYIKHQKEGPTEHSEKLHAADTFTIR